MLSSILCLLLLATPANGAGVTKTRLGVKIAMGHALHLPASMTEWTTANQKSIKDIAAHQHRALTSDDLFALESMQKYEEIMHSVFSEKNLQSMADERSALLEISTEKDRLVTHRIEDMMDHLDISQTAHKEMTVHHTNLVEEHARIRALHPEHHDVVPASLFELVAAHKVNRNHLVKQSVAATDWKDTLSKYLKQFVNAMKKIWNAFWMAIKIVARILLHLTGKSYVGLGLKAQALPVLGAGPLFQLCFDASGLLFGSATSQDIIVEEFHHMMKENAAIDDAAIAELNKPVEDSVGLASDNHKAAAQSIFLQTMERMNKDGVGAYLAGGGGGSEKEEELSEEAYQETSAGSEGADANIGNTGIHIPGLHAHEDALTAKQGVTESEETLLGSQEEQSDAHSDQVVADNMNVPVADKNGQATQEYKPPSYKVQFNCGEDDVIA